MVNLECDTAASHNVISSEIFDKLNKSVGGNLVLKNDTEIVIRLADGSVSHKSRGYVNLKVSLGNDRKRVVELLFFVVKGPNNLLGRLALEKLWPKVYSSLSNAACLTRVASNDTSGNMSAVDLCAVNNVPACKSAIGDTATAAAVEPSKQRPAPQTESTNLKKRSIPLPLQVK